MVAVFYPGRGNVPDGGTDFVVNLVTHLGRRGVQACWVKTAAEVQLAVELSPATEIHLVYPCPDDGDYEEVLRLSLAGNVRATATMFAIGFSMGRGRALRRVRQLLAAADALYVTDLEVLRYLRIMAPRFRHKLHPGYVGSNIGEERVWSWRGTHALGYFGYVDRTKGVEDLVELLVHEPDWELVMIGAPQEPRSAVEAEIQARAKELGVWERITWTGFKAPAECLQLIGGVDAMVLPFRRNSTGRSSLAASLAAGCPTVVTRPPISQRLHGVTYVRRGDVAAIRRAVLNLFEHRDLAERASQLASESYMRLMSWDQIARRVVE